ncbi:MAG: tetratricopeptide repeat protein [Verrucomicrobium sp.]|nr:tetratricopeptide repeat protein [Verrucomicrobium sp.]
MTAFRSAAALLALLLVVPPLGAQAPAAPAAAQAAENPELEKRIAALTEKVQKNPQSRLAHIELGKVLYENGRGYEAMKILKTALDMQVPQPDAPLSLVMINLGQCLETEKQLRLAIQVYETALKEEEKERGRPEAFGPGYRDAIKEYLDKAKAAKDKAIKHFETANDLRKKNDRMGAVLELQQCLNLAVDFGDVWRVQGEILAEAGKHQPAVVSFQRSLDLFAKDAETLTLMGRSFIQLKQMPQAVDAFQKALAIDPTNIVAIDGLAKARAMMGAAN